MDWQHEVWAEALWVEEHKGDEGPLSTAVGFQASVAEQKQASDGAG